MAIRYSIYHILLVNSNSHLNFKFERKIKSIAVTYFGKPCCYFDCWIIIRGFEDTHEGVLKTTPSLLNQHFVSALCYLFHRIFNKNNVNVLKNIRCLLINDAVIMHSLLSFFSPDLINNQPLGTVMVVARELDTVINLPYFI
jgi:hypothetical protein